MRNELTIRDLPNFEEFKNTMPGKNHTMWFVYDIDEIEVTYANLGVLSIQIEDLNANKNIGYCQENNNEDGYLQSQKYIVQKINEYWRRQDEEKSHKGS